MSDVIAIAEKAIAFLESLEGDESEQGLQAAQNLRSSLAKVVSDRDSALIELQYGLSWKGVLDWRWSKTTSEKLVTLCSEFSQAWLSSHKGT